MFAHVRLPVLLSLFCFFVFFIACLYFTAQGVMAAGVVFRVFSEGTGGSG